MGEQTNRIRLNLFLQEEEAAADQAMERFKSFFTEYEDDDGLEDEAPVPDLEYMWDAWEKSMSDLQNARIHYGRGMLLDWLKAHDGTFGGLDPEQLDEDEIQACCDRIHTLCGRRVPKPVIKNVFDANKSFQLVPKQAAFDLGHALGWNEEEMGAFLLRYYQDSAQDDMQNAYFFDPKRSNDMIELFTFRFPDQDRDLLKNSYAERSADIKKCRNVEEGKGATQRIYREAENGKLPWMEEGLTAEARRDHFLDWLVSNAAFMDQPSDSATELARLLARKILQLLRASRFSLVGAPVTPKAILPHAFVLDQQEADLVALQGVLNREHAEGVLQREQWEKQHWESAARVILYFLRKMENGDLYDTNERVFREIDTNLRGTDGLLEPLYYDTVGGYVTEPHRPDNSTAFYAFLIQSTKGTWRRYAKNGEDMRLRLQMILTGKIIPQKSDCLLLCLMLANLVWELEGDFEPSIDVKDAFETMKKEVSEFEILLDGILDGEHFPAVGKWHIPHFTEMACFSSIVWSAASDYYFKPMNMYLRLITVNDPEGRKPKAAEGGQEQPPAEAAASVST